MMSLTSSGLSGRGFESHSRHPFSHLYPHIHYRDELTKIECIAGLYLCTAGRPSQLSGPGGVKKSLHTGTLESETPSRGGNTVSCPHSKAQLTLFRFDLPRLPHLTHDSLSLYLPPTFLLRDGYSNSAGSFARSHPSHQYPRSTCLKDKATDEGEGEGWFCESFEETKVNPFSGWR